MCWKNPAGNLNRLEYEQGIIRVFPSLTSQENLQFKQLHICIIPLHQYNIPLWTMTVFCRFPRRVFSCRKLHGIVVVPLHVLFFRVG